MDTIAKVTQLEAPKATEHTWPSPTQGSQWSQAVHTGSKESRACSPSELEWSVHWSQNRNTKRKLVDKKGIYCPVLLFRATYQGFMTLDCAEGKGPGENFKIS